MNALGLFLTGAGTGLVAGGTSCAAVQIGLLTGAVREGDRPAAPVGTFLGTKLAVHVALGAVLGLAGAAVQPAPRIRAVLLLSAAVTLGSFAVRLLRRPVCPVPATARSLRGAGWLGAATVFVPCGLTLSAEFLAVTSRSALGGAAVMGGFVLGTVPLFGLLGVGLGKGLSALRGRLVPFVGVALLAVAGWTLLSGLRLGGWLPQSAPAASAADARFVQIDTAGRQIITVYALSGGYRPAILSARAGLHTTLRLRTVGGNACTRDFVIPSSGTERVLPRDGVTDVDLGTPARGTLRYTCAIGHYVGFVEFR